MTGKFNNLEGSNFTVASRWKIWTAVSLGIILIGAVIVAAFGFNLGIDFAGGTTLDVEVGTYITEENYQTFEDIVISVVEELELHYTAPRKFSKGGELYGISLRFTNYIGSSASAATSEQLRVIGKLLNGKPGTGANAAQATVGELKALSGVLKSGSPVLADLSAGKDDSDKVTYKGIYNRINDKRHDGSFTGIPMEAVKINSETITAGYSASLFLNALLALGIALVAIMIYIVFRFELRSGIAAAIALLHNILVMAALTAIFRVQINSPFVAAIITIVAYSINDIIVQFDRIRENRAKAALSDAPLETLVDTSVRENLRRTFNTFFTTVVTVIILVALSVAEIQEFALPIIFGLVAGVYGSVFIAPSLWVLLEKGAAKRREGKENSKDAKDIRKKTARD